MLIKSTQQRLTRWYLRIRNNKCVHCIHRNMNVMNFLKNNLFKQFVKNNFDDYLKMIVNIFRNAFRLRNWFAKDSWNIKSITLWKKRFRRVDRIIVSMFNALIFAHIRKLIRTFNSAERACRKSSKNQIVCTNSTNNFVSH